MTAEGDAGGCFTAKDVELLELVLAQFPRVDSLARVARAVRDASEFPIESFEAAHGAWPEGELEYRGHRMSLEEASTLLGDDFFPVADTGELVRKLKDAWARAAGERPQPEGPDKGFFLLEWVPAPDELAYEGWSADEIGGDDESWGTPPDDEIADDSLPAASEEGKG